MVNIRTSTPPRLSPLLLVTTGIAIALGYYLQQQFPLLSDEQFLANNLGLVLLINLNILVILILGFLVAKNLIKLVLDRRKNILGSRLRARLVVAFVGLSFIPTLLLFMTARGILEHVMRGWFSSQVSSAVDGSLGIAREWYSSIEEDMARQTEQLASSLGELYREGASDNEIQLFLTKKRNALDLTELSIVDSRGAIRAQSISDQVNPSSFSSTLDQVTLRQALQGTMIVQPEQCTFGEQMRVYAFIADGSGERLLVTTRVIPPELSSLLESVIGAYDDYRELYRYRRPLASIFLLMLVIVLLLILFAAVWVGFYLARGLTVPIQELAYGTEQVAHGNLDYRIGEVADDELGTLVHSFNTMTEDLKRTTGELVSRRRYIEALLANIGVGVISIDRDGRVATCNHAASRIINLDQSVLQKPLKDVLPIELWHNLEELLDTLSEDEKVLSTQFVWHQETVVKSLQFTITRIDDIEDTSLGVVILIDDLTELVSAQRMAAWREVARRIAHEIKNPLTPIQLSAQRLERKSRQFSELTSEQRGLIRDCSDTITSQVALLKTLVNEFSQFARMPKCTPRPTNINVLITDICSIYSEGYSDIRFETDLGSSLPELHLDPEQITRAVGNLIDNAAASIAESGNSDGLIRISTALNTKLGVLSLSIEDNGGGISDKDISKIFDPYFTTKEGGTGLGLSIVSSVVTDHHGFIRVHNQYDEGKTVGVRFVLEFPLGDGLKTELKRKAL